MESTSSTRSSPRAPSPQASSPLDPEIREALFLTFVGLAVRACQERRTDLLQFYLEAAQTAGFSPQEVKQSALRRSPGEPLLQ